MTKEIQTERRWLRSVIAASSEPLPNFPWMRGHRRRPAAMQAPEPAAIAPATAERPLVKPALRKPSLFGRRSSLAAH